VKILIVTPRVPYPPYRGDKIHMFNVLKRLAAKHEIHLVCFAQTPADEENLKHLQPYCRSVEGVKLPLWRSLLRCLAGLFSREPLQVHYFKSGRMRALIEQKCREHRFDVIHTHIIRAAQYTAHLPHAFRAIDVTDAVSLYLRRFLSQEKNWFKRAVLKVEAGRIKKYQSILEDFDACFVCSEVDAEELRKSAPAARIEVLPNGVDVDCFYPQNQVAYDPSRIIFTGNLSYYPNADAVLYFVQEIFPFIKAEVPQAQLYLVGQSPPRKIQKLAREDVVVTGFVEDIREYYLRSAVMVSPIRFGAGTLNKVLESLAMGVPVVATPVGIEGLGLTNGKEILIAHHPRTFADHVIRVLKNPELRKQLGQAGMALVRERYNWDSIVASLESFYREACERMTLVQQ